MINELKGSNSADSILGPKSRYVYVEKIRFTIKNNFTGSKRVELRCVEYLIEKHKFTYRKQNFRVSEFFN